MIFFNIKMEQYFNLIFEQLQNTKNFIQFAELVINKNVFESMFAQMDIDSIIFEIKDYYDLLLQYNKKIIKYTNEKTELDFFRDRVNDIRKFLTIVENDNSIKYIERLYKINRFSLLCSTIKNLDCLIVQEHLKFLCRENEEYFFNMIITLKPDTIKDLTCYGFYFLQDDVYVITAETENKRLKTIETIKSVKFLQANEDLVKKIRDKFKLETEGFMLSFHPFKIENDSFNYDLFKPWEVPSHE